MGGRPGHGLDKGKDKVRILPDYDELRRLFLDEGMTYREIGEKYGVTRDAVFQTLRNRTLRRGEPWPLNPPDHGDRVRRGSSAFYSSDFVDARRLAMRLQLRLELNNEGYQPFAKRYHLDKDALGRVLRGERTEVRQQWAEKVWAALRAESER